jgi:hypothetical protein
MKNDLKQCFKASGIWFLLFVVMLVVSCSLGVDGIVAVIGLFSLFASVFTFLYGVVNGVVNLIKIKIGKQKTNEIVYKKKDSDEFIQQVQVIEKQFNERIQKEQLIQTTNTKTKDNLQITLDGKKRLKKQCDDIINSFLKENVYKVGRISINMIDGTVEYYTTKISLEKITDIQVKCNSQVITKSNTSEQRQARRGLVSTMGRAAVGTVAFGAAGAVLGLTGKKKTQGSSSTTTTQTRIDDYSVIILTTDIKNSIITIPCGHSEEEALRISNSINNAAVNVGTVETDEYDAKIIESEKLMSDIKELQDQIKNLNSENKEITKTINTLITERNKQIKQLTKQFR